MDIRDTHRFFANDVITDAYTEEFLFNAKLDSYDLSVRDSATSVRRLLTVEEDAEIPTRKCLSCNDQIFIAGNTLIDTYNGSVLKRKVIVHPATGLASIRTTAEVLNESAGTPMYLAQAFLKQSREEQISSEAFPVYNFFAASTETTTRNYVITLNSGLYRVQSIENTVGGFKSFMASEIMSGAVQAVSYTGSRGTYIPATGLHTAIAPITISALVERYQTGYRYPTSNAVKYVTGDILATILKTDVASPATGDLVTVGGTAYFVLEFADDLNGSWELHLR